ncbi:hypothetical protein HPB47_026140 [Ixodes persulcatus]|uniref:Uncharacterized protein n=1 Tax=Ixodes persulcatus TaxID=34615 RepID=A0AC60Q1D4_IXOPE|nr:hypothetical protein HPB47_026140 [Ixodes persulcatus]
MSHVLVKWVGEETWDVYPLRAVVDTQIGFRLLIEENATAELRGRMVDINWENGEPPALAELLDFGTERAMERRRAKLAESASDPCGDEEFTATTAVQQHPKKQKVEELQAQVQVLEEKLSVAENNYDAYNIVKKLRKIVRTLNASQNSTCAVAETVNIGDGVLVVKTLLARLHSHCRGAPAKFARNLVRNLFSREELRNKSLFGKGTNSNKGGPVKEAIDQVRLNAILARIIKERRSHWLSCGVVPKAATREALSMAAQSTQRPGEVQRCGPGRRARSGELGGGGTAELSALHKSARSTGGRYPGGTETWPPTPLRPRRSKGAEER